MQVTAKKSTVIPYLPQEIRETTYTDIIYRPVTREMLEQLFSNSAKKDKHKLVKKKVINKAASECYFKCCLYLITSSYK